MRYDIILKAASAPTALTRFERFYMLAKFGALETASYLNENVSFNEHEAALLNLLIFHLFAENPALALYSAEYALMQLADMAHEKINE